MQSGRRKIEKLPINARQPNAFRMMAFVNRGGCGRALISTFCLSDSVPFHNCGNYGPMVEYPAFDMMNALSLILPSGGAAGPL